MRMRELAARSELPRTTIQHYLREGLLPEPERPARNAAVYGDEHLERLRLIQRLRGPGGGGLPVAQVRRVIELVEQGIDADLAIGLQKAVVGEGFAPPGQALDLAQLAERTGTDVSVLNDWLERGMLVPAWVDGEPYFDAADVELLEHLSVVRRLATPAELGKIATKIEEISRLEMGIRNRAVEELDDDEAIRLTLDLQRCGNYLHRYLFARYRQRDIEALRGGIRATREVSS